MLKKYGKAKCLEMVKESIARFQKSDDVWVDGSLAQLWICADVLRQIVHSQDPNWALLNDQIEDIYERAGITELN